GTHARQAFNWFMGQNQLQQALYDATTGGCRDGLHPERVNENQGAESTLSFLLALLEMRSSDRISEVGSSLPRGNETRDLSVIERPKVVSLVSSRPLAREPS
ncbi:MAG TPA: hypothetical protein VF395_16175, partial [Polyangiaceae bacterium]